MKKKYLVLGAIVLVAAAISFALYMGFGSLGHIVKAGVEKYGPEMTQANVKLDGVTVDIGGGKLAMNGLLVGNPKGFQTADALKLGQVTVKLDMGTLTKDPVVIDEVSIQSPEITWEAGAGGSNLNTLSKNIKAYTGGGKGGSDKSEGPKLVIKDLYIRDGHINVSAKGLKGKTLKAPLADIHLRDIGKDKNGATVGEVAQSVMKSITAGSATAVSGLGLDTAKGTLDKIGDKLKGLFQN